MSQVWQSFPALYFTPIVLGRMTTTPELLLPYGCSASGMLVPVADAVRGEPYTCPGCSIVLVLRDSAAHKRRKHFAHPSNGACSQESIFHATAKRLIANAIRDHAVGKRPELSLHVKCDSCVDILTYPVPVGKFTDAAEEYSIDGYRCDVVGLDGAGVRLAIEIMHTHATTDAKVGALSVPMIELVAVDVLTDPNRWAPIRHTLKPRRCENCKEHDARIARNTAELLAVRASPPTYRPSVRPTITPAPAPKPVPPAPAPEPVRVTGNATRHLWANSASLRPFMNELEQYLQSGGRGNPRRGRKRF